MTGTFAVSINLADRKNKNSNRPGCNFFASSSFSITFFTWSGGICSKENAGTLSAFIITPSGLNAPPNPCGGGAEICSVCASN